MNESLGVIRADFEREMNRSVSMPMAGAIVWTVVAIVSLRFDVATSALILMFATGAIFPVALLIAKVRNERLMSSNNPLAKLMGMCVLMINLLWALYIPLFLLKPSYVILGVGIGAGLHWIVYSWIVQHPLGVIHSLLRTLLVVVMWYMFPEQPLFAVGMSIVAVYCLSIWQMLRRPLLA